MVSVVRISLLGLAGPALAQHNMGPMDSMDPGSSTAPSTLLTATGTASLQPATVTSTNIATKNSPMTMTYGVYNGTSTGYYPLPPTQTPAPLPAGGNAMAEVSGVLIALVLAAGVAAQY